MKTVLTIAGSDSGGGAGIQADLKTMMANGVYGMCAVTALTAQNTLGVDGVLATPPDFLGKQLDSVFSDILPDAVKIGMVCSAEQIEVIAERLVHYRAKNIVLDTVMISTSGTRLMKEEAVSVMREKLFGITTVLTPNIPECMALTGRTVRTKEDMEIAARTIGEKFGCGVLCKGGHYAGEADDVLYWKENCYWYHGERIDNPNTHGTGCTLSSAIASNLALGYQPPEAVERAKHYISGALSAMLDIGHGNGPLNHGYGL